MIRSIGVKNLSKQTIQKIKRMIAAVLAEPEFYDQDTFARKLCKTTGNEVCGDTSCGAGWAIWLENPALFDKMVKAQYRAERPNNWADYPDWESAALKALGLEVVGEFDTTTLFGSASDWPSPFNDHYEDAETDKERAKVFAARWRHFIKMDGQEETATPY